MKLETLTVFLEERRKNTTNLSWRSNIEKLQDKLCSNMELFQDNVSFWTWKGSSSARRFTPENWAVTWNHGRHAFFVPIPYRTLIDKDKRRVNFVISKIHVLSYQPSQTEHAQNPWTAERTVVGYKGGHVNKMPWNNWTFLCSILNSRVSEILCIEISNPLLLLLPSCGFMPTTACIIVQSPNVAPFGIGTKAEIKICNSNAIKLI